MADVLDHLQTQDAFLVSLQIEAVRQLRHRGGESLCSCERCGNDIPDARQKAVPGVRVCVECQRVSEFLSGKSQR